MINVNERINNIKAHYSHEPCPSNEVHNCGNWESIYNAEQISIKNFTCLQRIQYIIFPVSMISCVKTSFTV